MRILTVHNHYQQSGGEDEVFAAEAQLLERHGHDVHRYVVRNDGLEHMGRLALARDTMWNRHSYHALRTLVRRTRPDVVHFHNTLPRISPSGYYAATREVVPVVQTLHNYRLVCPGALLFRNGSPCHECVGRTVALPGIRHGCYRGSRAATAAVAGMTAAHRMLGTWSRQVSLFVAPTEFARLRFIEGGLAAEQIVVKPNFVDPDPGAGTGAGGYALFVGRLSPEKGIRTLLEAWRTLDAEIPLRIVGDGPLAEEVADAARTISGVSWLGRQTPSEVAVLLSEAAFLVCPSECYETFGRVVIEAFAAGTPVVASDLGALAELVQQGRTGRLFRPGDAQALVSVMRELLSHRDQLPALRSAARHAFEERYGAPENYAMLMTIYRTAIDRAAQSFGGRPSLAQPASSRPHGVVAPRR
jgi:glycosyltransferase involved in cell wall biosynthesis